MWSVGIMMLRDLVNIDYFSQKNIGEETTYLRRALKLPRDITEDVKAQVSDDILRKIILGCLTIDWSMRYSAEKALTLLQTQE
jgi:hypothetical protein